MQIGLLIYGQLDNADTVAVEMRGILNLYQTFQPLSLGN